MNRARLARLFAKVIDLFIVTVLCVILYPFGILLAIIYAGISDSFFEGQSFGKRLMGFAVISLEDGAPCTVKQSIIRNLPIVFPLCFAIIPFWGWFFSFLLLVGFCAFELSLLLRLDSGHRLGDVMADTSVVSSTPSRVNVRKAKQSWFDSQKKLSPCN